MNTIIGELGKNPKFISLVNNIKNEKSPIEISGLTDVGETSVIASINEFTKRPIILITYNTLQNTIRTYILFTWRTINHTKLTIFIIAWNT